MRAVHPPVPGPAAGGEKGLRKWLQAPFPAPKLTPLRLHPQSMATQPCFPPLGEACPLLSSPVKTTSPWEEGAWHSALSRAELPCP